MASFLRENGPWSRLIAREEIELRETPPGIPYELDSGIRVTPFAVPHRDEDSDTVGYIVQGPRRTLLYVPDTDRWETWNPTLLDRLAGCDVALLDGTFYSAGELPGRDVSKIGHPLITTSMSLLGAEASRARIAFTHLNHSNAALDPEGAARRAIVEAGFTVAAEGERYPL
jgi:pyrroloquinoline quinone biosynthesis protein B